MLIYLQGTIQSNVNDLQSAIDRYAKQFSAKTLEALMQSSEDTKERVMIEVAAIFRFNQASPAPLQDLIETPSAARLCLAGLLSHTIFTSFFANPFFFMHNDLSELDPEAYQMLMEHPEVSDEVMPSKSFLKLYEAAARSKFTNCSSSIP